MEGISAKGLDTFESDPKKRKAVKHLREMRDVLTPFVYKYTELFRESESDNDLPEINQPEFLTRSQYEAIFFDLQSIIKSRDPHFSSSLEPIMFECMGDSDMYDLLYEQYLLTETERRKHDPTFFYQSMLGDSTLPPKEEIMPLLMAMYQVFLQELDEHNIKDFFLNMSRQKRTTFAQNSYFVSYNLKEIKKEESNLGSSPIMSGIDSIVQVEKSRELIVGVPKGSSVSESISLHDEVFPHIVVFPIGEYGRSFTEKIFITMQAMYSKVELLKDEAKKMVAAHEKMFMQTARGDKVTPSGDIDSIKSAIERITEKGGDIKNPVARLEEEMAKAEKNYMAGILALEEGIATLAQVLNLFTAHEVAGYKTGEDLLRAIIEQDLPNKVGYTFSPALIGPFSLAGNTVRDIISVGDDGRLLIKQELLNFCGDKKEFFTTVDGPNLPASGRGCPVSFQGKDIEVSGITTLSRTFLKVFNEIKI